MTNDDQPIPHAHSNCVHVETGRGHMRTTIAAALAMVSIGPMFLAVNDEPPTPSLPYEPPKTFKARRRGPAKGMLAMMLELGAERAPRPPWSTPTMGRAFPCDNCDLAPDGYGHTGDARCLHYED